MRGGGAAREAAKGGCLSLCVACQVVFKGPAPALLGCTWRTDLRRAALLRKRRVLSTRARSDKSKQVPSGDSAARSARSPARSAVPSYGPGCSPASNSHSRAISRSAVAERCRAVAVAPGRPPPAAASPAYDSNTGRGLISSPYLTPASAGRSIYLLRVPR